MFTFRRPTDDDVRKLLARQTGQPWSYDCVEVTRDALAPHGWQIDHHRVLLGHGAETFKAACEAIRSWKMFPPEMTQVFWPDTPQQPGDVVAVLYRARPFCLWMLFPARVVYRVDDCLERGPTVPVGQASPVDRPSRPMSGRDGRTTLRYGFAYGTLPDHPERGEERFLVEWNQADDSVWYDLLAVSRPGHWLARIGYLYARYEQAKFRRLSGLTMQRECRVHE